MDAKGALVVSCLSSCSKQGLHRSWSRLLKAVSRGAVHLQGGRILHLSGYPPSARWSQPAFGSFHRRSREEATDGRCKTLRGTHPCGGMVDF